MTTTADLKHVPKNGQSHGGFPILPAPLPTHELAERGVVGLLLGGRLNLDDARAAFGDGQDAITNPPLLSVYRALLAVGKPDVFALVGKLADTPPPVGFSWETYLDELADRASNIMEVSGVADLVYEHQLRRRAIRTIWKAGTDLYGQRPLPAILSDVRGFIESSGVREASGMKLVRLSDVTPRPIRWLWPGRLPSGCVSIIAGDGDLGKSFTTLDLAARITTGTPWPDRPNEPNEVGDVVLLTAEDPIDTVVRPRFDAARGDPERIHILESVRLTATGDAWIDLGHDCDEIERAVSTLKDCRLIIIDPISSYLGAIDSHKNDQVRAVLGRLARLAERLDVAVLAIHHLNKNEKASASYRMVGSVAFRTAVRMVHIACLDANDPTEQRRLLLIDKCNIAKKGSGLAYSIMDTDRGAIVAWEQGAVDTKISDAMATERRTTRTDDVEQWLRDKLADGPLPSKEVIADGKAAGFGYSAIRSAQGAIGIRPRKRGFQGEWIWELPIEQLSQIKDHDPTLPCASLTPLTPLDSGAPTQQPFNTFGESGESLGCHTFGDSKALKAPKMRGEVVADGDETATNCQTDNHESTQITEGE